MLPHKQTSVFVIKPNKELSKETNESTSKSEDVVCNVCEAKQDYKQVVSRENLEDIRVRSLVTYAYAKAVGEIPSCSTCRKDYFHYIILSWGGRDELLLGHSCLRSECDKYVKNSWLILPNGLEPLRHSTKPPFDRPCDDVKRTAINPEEKQDGDKVAKD